MASVAISVSPELGGGAGASHALFVPGSTLEKAGGAFHAASFARAPLALSPQRAAPSGEPSPQADLF